ncbi:tripartite tricarboxylate transporter substrate binding protein [Pigmentiphaga soli]|uniref:Tripartite tricarboxylate transporter substrate binding protein n=1 Tax=Pigmentiphaga soli TaxID=1007095 RepID=A0ABP8H0G2_9BURK
MRLKLLGTALSAALASFLCAPAGTLAAGEGAQAADDYPNHSVRIINPFPPGSSDTVARLLSEHLGKSLKQTFYIDNKPGASGALGTNMVAKAPADGYTLLFHTCAHAISAVSFKDLPYDAVKDLDPVSRVADSPMVLVANPKLPAQSVQQLIALAKSKPKSLNYASNGPGSITSLAMIMFQGMTGTQITDIPYKGAGPSLTALMAGEVDVMIAPLGAVSAYLKAGRLKALGIASSHRSPQAPDLPTVSEAGVPGFEATCWYGVLAPHGTPQPIVGLLNRHIGDAMRSAEMQKQLAAIGVEPATSTPAEFGSYIQSEIGKWGKVFKDSGATPE